MIRAPGRDGPTVAPFRAFPFLTRPHLQTIMAAKFHLPLEPPAERRQVSLPGGDRLVLEVSTPAGWRAGDLTAVLVHGLCGCAQSGYLVRVARKLHRRGIRAVRVNLRGCGAGQGLAREPYHSGRSEDVLAVLEELRREGDASRIALVGFSLGGNIALKLAGELGEEAAPLLEQVIAVCPPVDLLASSRRISSPANRLFERMFLKLLRKEVACRQARYPDLPRIDLPARLSLMEFDEIYTAPRCGFASALDYYRRASSLPLLSRIALPCRILLSDDDPLIDTSSLRDLALPTSVRVIRTPRGGHLGFLGAPWASGGFRWMDSQVLEWLEK